jgi:hypothetical protein
MYEKESRKVDKLSTSEKAVTGSWTAKDIAALKGLHRWKAQVSTVYNKLACVLSL